MTLGNQPQDAGDVAGGSDGRGAAGEEWSAGRWRVSPEEVEEHREAVDSCSGAGSNGNGGAAASAKVLSKVQEGREVGGGSRGVQLGSCDTVVVLVPPEEGERGADLMGEGNGT